MVERPKNEQFVQQFVRVEPRIYAYIRALVFNRSDADDLLQEVAAVLWRKFDEFQPGTSFEAWAFAVTRNQVLYFRQKQARNVLAFSQPVFDVVAETMQARSDRQEEFQQALSECLQRLSRRDREWLTQRYQPGATLASVARAVGRSPSTVSRALSRIQSLLLRCVHRSIEADR